MMNKICMIVVVAFIAEASTEEFSIPVKIKKKIPNEFAEVYKKMDNFGDHVTLGVLESYLKKSNSKVAECYQQKASIYEKFAETFSQQITNVAKGYGQFFVKKYEEYAKRVQAPLNRMANFMNTYPSQIKTSISNGDSDKAAKLIANFRTRVKFNDILFTAEMKKFTTEKVKVAKEASEAESRYKKIRQMALRNGKNISDAIEECIEGSKKVTQLPKPPQGLEWNVIDLWGF